MVAALVGVIVGVAESDALLGLLWAAAGFTDIAILVALVEFFRWRLGGMR